MLSLGNSLARQAHIGRADVSLIAIRQGGDEGVGICLEGMTLAKEEAMLAPEPSDSL
jgi:hypothetical protein